MKIDQLALGYLSWLEKNMSHPPTKNVNTVYQFGGIDPKPSVLRQFYYIQTFNALMVLLIIVHLLKLLHFQLYDNCFLFLLLLLFYSSLKYMFLLL